MQDLRTGQEFETDSRDLHMFPVDNLHLPLVASVFVVAVTAISSVPSFTL